MGAIFTQKLVKASFDAFTLWLTGSNIPLIGTSDHEAGVYYRDYAYSNPVLLMMGSERAGLPEAYIGLCDGMVTIPMEGKCDSLNLSVATAVILYEIHHQQHSRGGEK
jgi:TrmH family RNA methyltransferase